MWTCLKISRILKFVDFLSRYRVNSKKIFMIEWKMYSTGLGLKSCTFLKKKILSFGDKSSTVEWWELIFEYSTSCWPKKVLKQLMRVVSFLIKNNIEVSEKSLYYNSRIIVLNNWRQYLLTLLYKTHTGFHEMNEIVLYFLQAGCHKWFKNFSVSLFYL